MVMLHLTSFTAVLVKIKLFCFVTPSQLVSSFQHFEGS